MATRAGRFFADKSNGHHLLKSAPATGKFSPVGVACRRGRIFPHDNGMPALRARHRLAGMTIFNLDGIPAFIAIKNHPTSSTKQKNRYHRKQPGLKQQLHQSSTITKKYFIYFCHRPKKPRLQQEAAATGDLRRYHRTISCPDLLPCAFFTPPAYISTHTFKSSAVKNIQMGYYNTLPGGVTESCRSQAKIPSQSMMRPAHFLFAFRL
ncbi:hypothetical protein MWR57_01695 [Desulfovibrionaceae bacterium CB1MN]|uniref:hypothetical protein n=1 Tax=Hydrosulfovibrio ferrireducens TaxID=2934181 RepID=UPI003ABB12B6